MGASNSRSRDTEPSNPYFIDRLNQRPPTTDGAGAASSVNPRSLSSFVGRNRTVLISPFSITVTSFDALYKPPEDGGGEGEGGAATGDVAVSEDSSEDTASDAGFESPGLAVRKRDVLRHRKQVVFSFDVNIPSLSRTWRLRRTINDFARLNDSLYAAYGALTPDFPNLGHLGLARLRERAAYQRQILARKCKSYLSAAVELPRAMDCIPLREFLEISSSSFDPRLGPRFKEGVLSISFQSSAYSRCGPQAARQACMGLPVWNIRSESFWSVLRDSYLLLYENSVSSEPQQCILLDSGLRVRSGAAMPMMGGLCNPLASSAIGAKGLGFTSCGCAPGAAGDPHVVVLDLLQGQLQLQTRSRVEAEDWIVALRSRAGATPYTAHNALDSFAPPRKNAQTRWLVDGRNGFQVIAEALRRAKFEILISGWWLTPHVDVVRDHDAFSTLQELAKEMLAGGWGRSRSASIAAKKNAVERMRKERQAENEALGIEPGIDSGSSGVGAATGQQLPRHRLSISSHRAEPGASSSSTAFSSAATTTTRPAPPVSADTGIGADDPPPLDRYPSLATIMAMKPSKGDRSDSPEAAVKGQERLLQRQRQTQVQGHEEAAGKEATPQRVMSEEEVEQHAEQLALMQILKERADAGVSCYIFFWQEPPMSLGINSRFQKEYLQALSPNIHAIRHGSLFFTHHAKIVCCDRVFATLGGLDVCWGRFDVGAHPVGDPDNHFFPQGVDYYNSAFDFVEVDDINQQRFSRKEVPRMAWHDVHLAVRNAPLIAGGSETSAESLSLAISAASGGGGAIQDIVRFFCQRWNHARNVKGKQRQPVLIPHSGWDSRVCLLLQKASIGGPLRPEHTLHDVGLQAKVVAMFTSGAGRAGAAARKQGQGDIDESSSTSAVKPAVVGGRGRVGGLGKAILAAAASQAGGGSAATAAASTTTVAAAPLRRGQEALEEDGTQTSPTLLPPVVEGSNAAAAAPAADASNTREAQAEAAALAAATQRGYKILTVHRGTAATTVTTSSAATMTPPHPENVALPAPPPPPPPPSSAATAAAASQTAEERDAASIETLREKIKAALETDKQKKEDKKTQQQQPPPPPPPKVLPIPTMDSKLYCSTDWTQMFCNSHVQVLRSAGEWSAGTQTEHSIFNAWIAAILHSKHVVYIEQQYFLSPIGWSDVEMAEIEVSVQGTEGRQRAAPGQPASSLGPLPPVRPSAAPTASAFTAATTTVATTGSDGGEGGSGAGGKWRALRGKLHHEHQPHHAQQEQEQGHQGHHQPSASETTERVLMSSAPDLAGPAGTAGGDTRATTTMQVQPGHGRSRSAWSVLRTDLLPSRFASPSESGQTFPTAGGLSAPSGDTGASAGDTGRRSHAKESAKREAETKQLKRLQKERQIQNRPMTLFHPAGGNAGDSLAWPYKDLQEPGQPAAVAPAPATSSSSGSAARGAGTRWSALTGPVFRGGQQAQAQPSSSTASSTGGMSAVDVFRLALQQERQQREQERRASSLPPSSPRGTGAAAPVADAPTAATGSKLLSVARRLQEAARRKKEQDVQGQQQQQQQSVMLSSLPVIPAAAGGVTQTPAPAPPLAAPPAPAQVNPLPGSKKKGPKSPLLVGELGREKASMPLRVESLPTSFTDDASVAAATRRGRHAYRASGLSAGTELTSLMLDEEAEGAERAPAAHGATDTGPAPLTMPRGDTSDADEEEARAPTEPKVAAFTTGQERKTSAQLAAFADIAEESVQWRPDQHGIGEALYYRLCRAIENDEQFKVVVILPVHPDGPIRTVRAIQLVLMYQQMSISRGRNSLLGRLAEKYPHVDLSRYIIFLSLRNYDKLAEGGKVVTEQIYVHSKILLVDDRIAIIGSANINQRSMMGNRDSEVALLVTGGDKITTRLGGKRWTATVFAHTLRRNLMEEHFGIAHCCRWYSRTAVGDWPGSNAMALIQYQQQKAEWQQKAFSKRQQPQAAPAQTRGRRQLRARCNIRLDNAHLVVDPKTRILQPQESLATQLRQAKRRTAGGPAQAAASTFQQTLSSEGNAPAEAWGSSTRQEEEEEDAYASADFDLNAILLPRFVHIPLMTREEQKNQLQLSTMQGKEGGGAGGTAEPQSWGKALGIDSGSSSGSNGDRAASGDDEGFVERIQGLFGFGDSDQEKQRQQPQPQPQPQPQSQGPPSSPFPPRPSPRPTLQQRVQEEAQPSAVAPESASTALLSSRGGGNGASDSSAVSSETESGGGGGPLSSFSVAAPTASAGAGSAGAGGAGSAGGVVQPIAAALSSSALVLPLTPPSSATMAPSPVASSGCQSNNDKKLAALAAAADRTESRVGRHEVNLRSPWDTIIDPCLGEAPTSELVEAKTDPDADNAALDNADVDVVTETAKLAKKRILGNIRARSQDCPCDVFMDPTDEAFFEGVLKAAARHNTHIYERCFPGIMSSTIKTMEEWQQRDNLPPRDEHLLQHLVGHVCQYPSGFLSQTDLDTKAGEKENYMPVKIVQ